jgi:hypothetical protein
MFFPASGYVEIERLTNESPLASDEKTFDEKAKVVLLPFDIKSIGQNIAVGDIIFFRPHGFFELTEHDGVKHCVVRVSEEFILGVIKNVAEK